MQVISQIYTEINIDKTVTLLLSMYWHGLSFVSELGIVVDFGKKALKKKHPSKEKKSTFLAKKAQHPFHEQKAL